MTITPRKLKNGKTVYDVQVMHNGRRLSQTCYSLKSARRTELDFQSGYEKGMITLSSYIETVYEPLARKRLAQTSYDTYEKEIRLRIVPHLGDKRIRDITRRDIQDMLNDCSTETVAKKAHSVLKTILNEAVGDGRIDRNPAKSKFAYPKFGEKRDNGIVLNSFAQIGVYLDAVEKYGDSALIKLAYTGFLQGMRPEERYALDWKDIDTFLGVIRISKAYVATSKGFKMKSTKTERSTRTVPIHPRFKKWLEDQPHTDGPFMKDITGKRLSPATIRKRWARFLKAHPYLPPVTIENMRHSFATSFLASGGRVETLSKLLGHTKVSTTYDRYVKPDFASLREEMEKLGDYR